MAKFSTTAIAVALFCLFTLSIAGDATENGETAAQVSLPLSEAAVLRLPSDTVNTETESNSGAAASSAPLTKMHFGPCKRFRGRLVSPCLHYPKLHDEDIHGDEDDLESWIKNLLLLKDGHFFRGEEEKRNSTGRKFLGHYF